MLTITCQPYLNPPPYHRILLLLMALFSSVVAAQSFHDVEQSNPEIRVEQLFNELGVPWGMAFISPQRMLITERNGQAKLLDLQTRSVNALQGTLHADAAVIAAIIVTHCQLDLAIFCFAMGEGAVGNSLQCMGHRNMMRRGQEPGRGIAALLVYLDRNREGREPGTTRRRQMLGQFPVEFSKYISVNCLSNGILPPLVALAMRHLKGWNTFQTRLNESLEDVRYTHLINPR
jgi:hypothetical protein